MFGRVNDLPKDNFRLQSDFACYLCILVAGFVETTISELAIAHCRNRSRPTVTRYIEHDLRRLGVPNAERLLQFVGRFDPNWREELKEFIAGERKDALDSVVANRNEIAHGRSVGITYSRVQDYYINVCQIVDFLRDKFN